MAHQAYTVFVLVSRINTLYYWWVSHYQINFLCLDSHPGFKQWDSSGNGSQQQLPSSQWKFNSLDSISINMVSKSGKAAIFYVLWGGLLWSIIITHTSTSYFNFTHSPTPTRIRLLILMWNVLVHKGSWGGYDLSAGRCGRYLCSLSVYW